MNPITSVSTERRDDETAMSLRHHVVSIMGIPVCFSSGDEELLEAAVEGFDVWRDSPVEGDCRVELRLSVRSTPPRTDGEPHGEVIGSLLRMTGGGIRAEVDAVAEFGHCAVVPEYIGDPARLASEVLDPLVLFLLARRDRVPVHAAGAAAGTTAILLVGARGVGKSTLALAAVDAGFRLLSDEAVYVQTDPGFRIWGYPRPIRILDPADRRGRPAGERTRKDGRWKSSVPLSRDEVALHADRPILCLVIRDREAVPRRLPSAEAGSRLMRSLRGDDDAFAEQLPCVLDWLARDGAWEVPVSSDAERNALVLRGIVSG